MCVSVEGALSARDSAAPHPHHRALAKGSLFLMMGQAAGSLLRFCTNLLLTRVLTVGEYGLFSLGLTVFRLITEFALCGFQYGAQHFVPKYRASGDRGLVKGFVVFSFACTLCLSLFFGLLLYGFAGLMAQRVFGKESLEFSFRVLGLLLPLHVAMMLCAYYGIAFLKVHIHVVISDIIQPVLFCAFVAILWVLSRQGLAFVLGAYSASITLTLVAAGLLIRGVYGPAAGTSPAIYQRRQWGLYSGTVVFAGFFSMFLFQTDKIILGYYGSLEEIGIYNAAWKLYSFLGMSTVVFTTTFFPIISQVHAEGDLPQLNALTKLVGKWIFSANAFLIVIIVFYAKGLMRLFGKEFTGGSSILVIFGLSWILVSMLASTSGILRMTGRQHAEFVVTMAMLAFSVASGLILIPRYGMIGAAISSTASFILIHIAKAVLSYRYFGINPFGREMWLAFVFAFAAIGAGYAARTSLEHWGIGIGTAAAVIQFVVFAACYAALMLRFCLTEDDKVFIHIIRAKLRK